MTLTDDDPPDTDGLPPLEVQLAEHDLAGLRARGDDYLHSVLAVIGSARTVGAPPEVCHRCGGSGEEPAPRHTPTVPDDVVGEQHAILEQLRHVGEARHKVARKRNLAALQALEKSDEDIKVYVAEGTRLGLPQRQMADAVGISRVALWTITSGKRGG